MSPIMFDPNRGGFVIFDGVHCGESMYDTGCDAPGCYGYSCIECGEGCDREVNPEDGQCATALKGEPEDSYMERINSERRGWGLSEITSGEQ